MKAMKVLSIAAALILMVNTASASITLNEIRIDQGGSDASEYFELAGNPGESLTGLFYIVIGDGSGAGLGGAVEAIVDLTGLSIASDAHFLAAEATFGTGSLGLTGTVDFTTSINFENSDNVTHMLVSGLDPTINVGSGFGGTDLDIDDDGVIDALIDTNGDTIPDAAPFASVIDSIAFVETVGSGDLNYGPNSIGPDGSFVPAHIFRLPPDATGPWNIGPFGGGSDTPSVINPEPATLALLGFGGLLMLRRRR